MRERRDGEGENGGRGDGQRKGGDISWLCDLPLLCFSFLCWGERVGGEGWGRGLGGEGWGERVRGRGLGGEGWGRGLGGEEREIIM